MESQPVCFCHTEGKSVGPVVSRGKFKGNVWKWGDGKQINMDKSCEEEISKCNTLLEFMLKNHSYFNSKLMVQSWWLQLLSIKGHSDLRNTFFLRSS